MADRHDDNAEDYPADDARQGEIVLKSRRRRVVFIGGLVGLVVLALLVAIFA